ncbi:nucleic acid-binding protein [Biscogniauxia marginata]|nr:nucleic acid-binding protein [Biscogniauxia marginata]
MASEVLAAAATAATTAATTAARRAAKEFHGIVVSAGLMDKTVKVKLGGLRWEPRVQKYFKSRQYKLVHDPRNSVRQGDVVAITPTWRVSQHVRHVVKHIIAPYGEPIEARPAVPTLEERVAERQAKRAAKDERRAVIKEERARARDEERAAIKARKAAKLRPIPNAQRNMADTDTTTTMTSPDDVD